MSFIGNVPAESYSPVVKDTFSGDDSTTDFTLSIPATTNSVEVFVENVQQEPTDAYTISGTTLSFTAAPVTGTDNIYVIHRGPAVQQVVPPAGVALSPSTVTATGDISTEGDLKVEVASGGIYTITGTDTASNRTLTLPDEAGTVLTSGTDVGNFPSGFANGITEADVWRIQTGINTTNSSGNVITSWERADDPLATYVGTGVSQASGVFTFPTTGKWLIQFSPKMNVTSGSYIQTRIRLTEDNTNYTDYAYATSYDSAGGGNQCVFTLVSITDTTNQKMRIEWSSNGTGVIYGNDDNNLSPLLFLRIA